MLNRMQPVGQPGAYQTFAYRRDSDVRRKAACQEVGCLAYRHGWVTSVDETSDIGRAQAHYIRTQSGRTFRESRSAAGLTVFTFEAHQRCFADHQTIAEVFYLRGGDWRQNQGVIRRHANGLDWAEDFGEHTQRLADEQQKG